MTLSEFRSWALSQGQVGKYDDGQFVGECVSLVNQYCYRVLGVPAGSWGNAYAWANDNNPNRQYFDKVSAMQPGDIIVYGTGFTPLYGHIGIYVGNNQLLDQNGHKVQHVAVGVLFNGYDAILRHKGDDMAKTTNETMRMLYYAFWGQTGQHGTPNALAGDLDADINQNWVGKDLEQTMKDFFYAPQGDAYRKLAAEDASGGAQYTPVTEQLFKKK